ncbi:MAG: biopolymer transporter ExbD [Deltaproteobacteria bacterium]|nr:biopolymer transporter ExbD [Deltaproteobacteria bacterium]
MKKIFSRQRRVADELNMAPLIDMIFILLIFFLVTTSFVKEAGVDVQRPIASSAKSKEKTNLIVAVTHEGSIYAEGRMIDVRSVRAYMERFVAENPKGSVVIAADKDSRTGIVIQVLDSCRLAGVKNVSVAARKTQ